MICGSEGWKVGSLKKSGRCGGMWSDEKWKIARRCACPSQHVQVFRVLGPLLEVEMSKKCTPLWHEAHVQVKMYKTPHARTTFGSWHVEKVHAVVARSTFQIQKCKRLRGLEHFLKFRCRFACQAQGIVHLAKSERNMKPLLQFLKYNYNYNTLHYTTIHCATLHYITLRNTPLYYTMLHHTTLHHTTLHYAALHCATQYTAHSTHYTILHYTTLYYTTLHALHYTTLHWIALHYATLHYTTTSTTTTTTTTLGYTTL